MFEGQATLFGVAQSQCLHKQCVLELFWDTSARECQAIVVAFKGVLLDYVVLESDKKIDPRQGSCYLEGFQDIMEDTTPAIPLTNLTKKDTQYKWTFEYQANFDSSKPSSCVFYALSHSSRVHL